MAPKQPHSDSLLTKLLLLALLGVGGVDAVDGVVRPKDVAGAVDRLAESMERRDNVVAVELKELRTELVEITKTMVVAVHEIREHDRRIGKLETERARGAR